MQKTAGKNKYYSKNESFLKMAKNGQKWQQCKGYSPWIILRLGQKLNMPKTCENRFYQHITAVLFKTRLEKTPNTRKMRAC